MLAIARWVTALPGAEGRIPAFSTDALLLATAGLLLLAIPVSKLRFLSAPLFALGFILAINTPKPDVLIDSGADAAPGRRAERRPALVWAGEGAGSRGACAPPPSAECADGRSAAAGSAGRGRYERRRVTRLRRALPPLRDIPLRLPSCRPWRDCALRRVPPC